MDLESEMHSPSQQQNGICFPNDSEDFLSDYVVENSEMQLSDDLFKINETSMLNGLEEYHDFNSPCYSLDSALLENFPDTDCQVNIESSPSTNCDSVGEFCFESDHIALKENSDYKKLLNIIIILEAKRVKAIKDLEKLIEMQEIALGDPLKFVECLQKGEDLGLPGPQRIPELPAIDWSKYTIQGTPMPDAKRHTRFASRTNAGIADVLKSKSAGSSTVRKHVSDKTKPASFNLPWTAEEQKKLEELLLEHPPEKIESRRWEKIASALGNRTPTQVASRVQKYFIKLTKAGIPVPGRAPNVSHLRKPRRHVIRQQPSTFLVSQTPTVYMLEEDEEFSNNYSYSLPESVDENSSDTKADLSDDEIHPDLKETAQYKEYVTLKKALHEISSSGLAQHFGYQCNRCGCKPIIGIRWHCTECPSPKSIDFCEDCVECMHESGKHTADHHLEPIREACSTFLDRDYMHFLGSDYNYLDPNYMPAT